MNESDLQLARAMVADEKRRNQNASEDHLSALKKTVLSRAAEKFDKFSRGLFRVWFLITFIFGGV
ncbi:hypothetical protein NQ315_005846 [Exocentrus adspersus]|uniref:Uncharacterized protein n=1 Tax=Exocentrus adspersus TaxID=1586481 RepID=A0AAV8VRH9_9CUCU|nr:hypothetical protein NQ315_005846 [Exocentrus adspersus]